MRKRRHDVCSRKMAARGGCWQRLAVRGLTKQIHMYKDWEKGVLSVLTPEQAATGASSASQKLPFFTANGTLSIPFDSPERYHWWKPDGKRLTVKETIAELRARQQEVENGTAF